MNTVQPKWMLQSKTIWGGLIALAIGIVPMFGLVLDAGDITDLNGLFDRLLDIVDSALVFGAGVLAIWGRFTAKQPVTSGRSKPNQLGYLDPSLLYLLSALSMLVLVASCNSPAFKRIAEPFTPDGIESCTAIFNAPNVTVGSEAERAARIKICESRVWAKATRNVADERILQGFQMPRNTYAQIQRVDQIAAKALIAVNAGGGILSGDENELDALINQLELWLTANAN